MKVVFAGIIARYPFGGVTWCSLMYLLGLRALGHEVLYIEDTGECIYDPERNALSPDPSYGTRYIHDALEPFGLGSHWCFVNYDGTYHGCRRESVREYCSDADLFVNLSGGSWFWRDEYARIPRRVFVDSDPCSRSWRLRRARGGTSTFSAGSTGCSPLARTSVRRSRMCPPASSPGIGRGNRWSAACGTPTIRRNGTGSPL
jgi:hypothetical protein